MWSGSFTKNAQAALTLAEKTAARLHTGYVGTEHILVGLLKEESGVAAKILEDNGADADKILEMIRDLIAPDGETAVKERGMYSPRARRVLEEAYVQAERFGARQCWNRASSAGPFEGPGQCSGTSLKYPWHFGTEGLC